MMSRDNGGFRFSDSSSALFLISMTPERESVFTFVTPLMGEVSDLERRYRSSSPPARSAFQRFNNFLPTRSRARQVAFTSVAQCVFVGRFAC
jgi:hypothetical protein